MSSLHDLVKNRPFTANCEVQTCFFLSKDSHSSHTPLVFLAPSGGAERDRTADPLLAKQVLSQLSYSPISLGKPDEAKLRGDLVGLGRLELPTPRLSSVCSNQLSYRP
jgi:hypothetical protein